MDDVGMVETGDSDAVRGDCGVETQHNDGQLILGPDCPPEGPRAIHDELCLYVSR